MIYPIRYYFVVILVVFAAKGISQDSLTTMNVEQKSYQLYLDKNWSELIKFGNKAVHEGYDYFYLQLRIGIAYYEKKNYNLAEGHFRKALSFNSDDELTQEYLYYCYLYVGRYEEARLLSKKFSEALSEKVGTNQLSKIGFVMIEGGTKITDSVNYYNKANPSKPNYFSPPTYLQFGLNHYIKNRISLFHALTYFNQQTFVNKVKQYQYYLKATIPLRNNFSISPSFQYIGLNISSEYTKTTIDTLWPPGVPPHSLPPPGAPPFKTNTKTISSNTDKQSNYYVGSVAIQKIIGKFTLGIGTTISNMNDVTQYINSGFLSYHVLGNSKLVLGCTGYLHTEDAYSSTNTSIAPFIYTQPAKWIAFKLSYFSNTKRNILEDNGYLVNNSVDLTTSRYSAFVNLTLNKHASIYGLYQLENKHEGVQGFNYRYNVIVGGIKITP
jgi:tetratricopeptide (TPR) repeat protein